MQRYLILFALSFSLFSPGRTLARGDGDLWAFFVGIVCVAQRAEYGKTSFGQRLIEDSTPDSDLQLLARCGRAKPWASDKLCAETVGNFDKKDQDDFDLLYQKHAQEIRRVMETLEQTTETRTCPHS